MKTRRKLADLHRRRKPTAKKHKTWDGDGILHVTNGYARLQDASGREMGRITFDAPLLPGSTLSIGMTDVEVDSVLPKEEPIASHPSRKSDNVAASGGIVARSLPKVDLHTQVMSEVERELPKAATAPPPQSLATHSKWKTPLLERTVLPTKKTDVPIPRHDPHAPEALVMKRPESVPMGKEIVDVVVDPLLTQHLREHQREGVKFLYECVMGMRDFEGQGAILADEMGLGKTLQTIALLWTLLKQNPIYGSAPTIRKAMIVCPVTLINNWRKEFRKWLGPERLGVFVADGSKSKITDFTMGKSYNVMIVGYERLRTFEEALKKGSGIDIVVADEGHRLKTSKNKSAQAIKALATPRRIILSGTPIQNDLGEFFMMVDLVNPNLLSSSKKFAKEYAIPITKSRQPEATTKEVEKGEGMKEELVTLTGKFILRRNADILSQYLPSKTEYVLLCRPTAAQISVYHHILACPTFQSAMGNPEASLQLITLLKKICNSPFLLNNDAPASTKPISPLIASVIANIPRPLLRNNAGSTKIRALDQLLHTLRTTTKEKVVLVSNYTATLDLLATLLASLSLPYLRLDGSTPSSKRQDLVDTFNRSPVSASFAFLLSAKAGGTGLNLVGASRLVLFDVDWNPATDLQAMARIHRDGQKNKCVIYRFLMAGGIDEKIWQRQITKIGLASNVMDQKGGTSNFTRDELRDLFRLDEGLTCQTHDLLGCACGGRGMPDAPVLGGRELPFEIPESDDPDSDGSLPEASSLVQASKVNMAAQERKITGAPRKAQKNPSSLPVDLLMGYSHLDTSKMATEDDERVEALVQDQVLLNVLKDEGNRVSFVFARTSG